MQPEVAPPPFSFETLVRAAVATRRCCACGTGRVFKGLAAVDPIKPSLDGIRWFCKPHWELLWTAQDVAIEIIEAREQAS